MSALWNDKRKVAGLIVLLALLLVPAPFLPPHSFAQAVQSILGVGWKSAYLAAAISLQGLLCASLGLLAAFAVSPAVTVRGRILQLVCVPLVVIVVMIIIRSVKLGHIPVLANVIVPLFACFFGVGLGLLFRQQGWRVTLVAGGIIVVALAWIAFPDVSSRLSQTTEACLKTLVASAPSLPAGEERFGAILRTTFASGTNDLNQKSAVERNRAALLALGIALGHERLAKFAGLNPRSPLVQQASVLRQSTTLAGRPDWARHFSLSAALTVLENPFVSDAGGLMKEQLDALTRGSGFSFGDLAADRAGVRFAAVATDSETAARAVQARLESGFVLNDFFPPATDLPEDLTVEQFRRDFGGVGDSRYREQVRKLETRLNQCALLFQP